jgi:hypothetical protein
MPATHDSLQKIDSLDFRHNTRQLLLSYLLRVIGVVVFGWLFLIITKGITGNDTIGLKSLVDISIQSFPAIGSILLIALDVICVLYLHELVHAAVVFVTHRQKPHIGMRGFVIFAAAPDKVLTKTQFIVNAMAPFTVISLIGILFIFYIPLYTLSWVFIPTVVNAAAAGGDFMAVIWALKQPKNTKFIDYGDITNAYTEK